MLINSLSLKRDKTRHLAKLTNASIRGVIETKLVGPGLSNETAVEYSR